MQVKLEDATGELEAVLVGAQAKTFFGQCVRSAQGLHAVLRTLGAVGSSSGGDVGASGGHTWCELGLRAVLWRDTPVFRITGTQAAASVGAD